MTSYQWEVVFIQSCEFSSTIIAMALSKMSQLAACTVSGFVFGFVAEKANGTLSTWFCSHKLLDFCSARSSRDYQSDDFLAVHNAKGLSICCCNRSAMLQDTFVCKHIALLLSIVCKIVQ